MNTYYVEIELEGKFYLLKIECENLNLVSFDCIKIDNAVVKLPIGFAIESIEKV